MNKCGALHIHGAFRRPPVIYLVRRLTPGWIYDALTNHLLFLNGPTRWPGGTSVEGAAGGGYFCIFRSWSSACAGDGKSMANSRSKREINCHRRRGVSRGVSGFDARLNGRRVGDKYGRLLSVASWISTPPRTRFIYRGAPRATSRANISCYGE